MLQAITPGDDIFNYRFNLQKKSDIIQNKYLKQKALPVIKSFKDQMTGTEDIKTCIEFNNREIRNINETTLLINLFKKNSSMTSISNMITNNNNQIRSKMIFNKNIKLKSIPQSLKKSNSTANMNVLNSNKTLSILNIPARPSKNKCLKHSSSLPKLNVNNEYFENNKCNYLILKYTGVDNSKNEIKKKKYLVINSHKVINSLKSYSMPNDVYGKKLIDVIQQRINSGFYRNYKLNINQRKNYQSIQISQNSQSDLFNKRLNKKEENKKFEGTFLKDIYDDFLLPGKDNKYNYTVHKIFLSQILEKVFKKMVEIRDKTNKTITKEEIRQEYCNEVDNLRNTLLTGKDFRIINNIYNINNSLNIISIDLGRNHNLNDMGIIDESQERNEFINNTLEGKDKDRQSLTSNLFNTFNKTIHDEKSRKENLEKIESNFKLIHKEDNSKLLTFIKDKIKIPSKSLSVHDSFMNLYFNRIKSANHDNQITSNNKFSENYHIPSYTTSKNYFQQQEEELNNVEKFILNTKKLRYTLNIKEKSRDKERNLSYDSEGNIKNYFDVGLKLNPVFFDDIYDELQEQYNINNNMDKKIAQREMIKEILKYYLHKKGVNLKFNDKISKKYLSMLIQKKTKTVKKKKKLKVKKITQIKEESHLIEEIAKKIHKKIQIKKRRFLIDTENQRKKEQNKKNKTENNFWQKKNQNILNDSEIIKININKNDRQFTENNYLEMETNSSEFSDIPSELDSEISEMIRKKQEKEKNKIKDSDEGIYADRSGNKNRGGDFIISRPIDKDLKEKEKEKQKEEEEKEKEKQKEEEKKEENNNFGNLNLFLNVDEKGEVQVEKNKKKKEDKKINVSEPKKDIKQKQTTQTKKKTVVNIVQKYKDINSKINENKNIDNKPALINNANKDDNNNNSKNISNNVDNKKNIDNKNNDNINKKEELNKNKIKKEESDTKITSKKSIKSKDIKTITKKPIQKELEKITEEENKETNKSNKILEEAKETIKPKHINVLPQNSKRSKSVVSLYKNIKIEKEKRYSLDRGINEDNSENSMNNDLKDLSPTLEDKNNINESSINPTSDHVSIMGVINTIGLKEKTGTNNSKGQKNKMKGIEEEFEDDDEDLDEDIMKMKTKRKSSFHNNQRNKKMNLLDISIIDQKTITDQIRRKSASLDEDRNYRRIKYFLEKYDKENLKNEEEEENYEVDYFEEKSLDEEEDEKQREERRKRKLKKKMKTANNKDFRKFFIDENINKEEKEKKLPEKEIEVEPKKDKWEEKFKKFKLYIHKLKGMNQEEFKYDLFSFLQEEEKIDFAQKEQLNKIDRINKYKAFIMTSKLNKLKYNRFHSSNILFTPGCIFNTGGLFPE